MKIWGVDFESRCGFASLKIKFEIKDNITIDNNYDRILEKRYKDGKKIQLTYDAVGNLIGKTRINGGTSTTIYSYNDQDQLSSVKEDGITIASYSYDHKRQRVYSNSPGAQTYDGQKIYYWDTQGRIIGEQNISYAGVNTNAATVRYIYSGNQKVAMARPKNLNDLGAGEDIYYFINNAQGTPVLIVDAAGKSVSKINLDEWGNPGTVEGSRAEINYTGKKLDPKTGLYYFNQRYYDPEIGRFLTEDPKGQCFNPYLYSGNNPLVYVDANGELFAELFSFLGPLGTILGAAIDGATLSAGFSAGMQYLATGHVNWDQVGQAALTGAVSGGLNNFVGSAFQPGTLSKIVAHGVVGGINSSMNKGNFWNGFGTGAFAEYTSGAVDKIDTLNKGFSAARVVAAGVVGGAASSIGGGNFGQGFMIGSFQRAFNHEAVNHKDDSPMKKSFRTVLRIDHDTTPEDLGENIKGFLSYTGSKWLLKQGLNSVFRSSAAGWAFDFIESPLSVDEGEPQGPEPSVVTRVLNFAF